MNWLSTKAARALAAMFAVLVFATAVPLPVFAVTPAEVLPDPALEQRARELSKNLRCLVCQNQSIDDSDAPLARDLRLLVRERLKAGDSDAQIMSFVVDRYGEFVLLTPPFSSRTLLLWLTPLLSFGAAIYLARRTMSASQNTAAVDKGSPLTTDEERRIAELTGRES